MTCRGAIVVAVDQIAGKFHAVVEVHQPCSGAGQDHATCTVRQRLLSPPFDDELEATAVALASRDGIDLVEGTKLVGDWQMIATA